MRVRTEGPGLVLLITGPPGSGKTTVADLVAASFPRSVHVEADRFFRFIRSGFIEPWRSESGEQNDAVMSVISSAAADYADAGYVTIVEGILIPDQYLERVADALHDRGLDVSVVMLRTDLATALTRAAGRSDEPLRNPEAIEKIWTEFQGIDRLSRFEIDTQGRTTREAADSIGDRLAAGDLRWRRA